MAGFARRFRFLLLAFVALSLIGAAALGVACTPPTAPTAPDPGAPPEVPKMPEFPKAEVPSAEIPKIEAPQAPTLPQTPKLPAGGGHCCLRSGKAVKEKCGGAERCCTNDYESSSDCEDVKGFWFFEKDGCAGGC